MKSFFPYFGRKGMLAKEYGEPKYPTIIEPFAGGAGYSTYWSEYVDKVILVEKDPVIAGIWQYLIDASADDIMKIPADVTILDELKEFSQSVKDLVGMWFTRGSNGPRKKIAPANMEKKTRGDSSIWGEKIRDRIASQVELINHWEIIEGDYTFAPNNEAHWYIDPPYQTEGNHYKHSGKSINFDELGIWCINRLGHIDVCEANDADWLPFEKLRNSKNQRNKNYKEVVYSRRNNQNIPEGKNARLKFKLTTGIRNNQ